MRRRCAHKEGVSVWILFDRVAYGTKADVEEDRTHVEAISAFNDPRNQDKENPGEPGFPFLDEALD